MSDTPLIKPVPFQVDATVERKARRRRIAWPWISLAVLATLSALILWQLPTSESTASRATVHTDRASNSVDAKASRDAEFEHEYALRKRARTAAEIATDLRSQLQQHNAAAWGDARWATGTSALEQGKTALDARQYVDAASKLEKAQALLDALLKDGEASYGKAIATAQHSLANGLALQAQTAADTALKYRPSSLEAMALKHRAEQLPTVLKLLVDADTARARGQVEQAIDLTQRAIDVDGDYVPARALLTELTAAAQESGFLEIMTRGERALSDSRFDEARQAFTAAQQLEPNRPEPADGMKRLERAVADAQLLAQNADASKLEAAERWRDAATVYAAALKEDSGLAFAKEGYDRAITLARLYESIDEINSHPHSLSDNQTLKRARDLLTTGKAQTSAKRPGLQAKVLALSTIVAAAVIPVRLVLHSDNQTEVSIARIGRLGRFETREVQVRPGAYAIVGVRDGFRDVRQEVVVDGNSPPVEIRCSEPVKGAQI